MIQYNALIDPKYKNWCVIFSTITAYSNLHNITLSYPQIDEVYEAIGRPRGKWGQQDIDVPKIIKFLDGRYWTKTYLFYPNDWTNKKTERNLRNGMRWILGIRINDSFKRDTNDGVMNSSAWANEKTTVWHCMAMYDNGNRYLVDIFAGTREHNEYIIPQQIFNDIKKHTNSFYLIWK